MSETPNYYLVTPLTYTGAAGAFTYESDLELPLGQIVTIPIGRRQSLGVVTQRTGPPEFKTRPITTALDLPPVPEHLRTLADWMAAYYASSPSAVWSTMLPTGLTKSRREGRARKPIPTSGLPTVPLTDEQAVTLTAIRAATNGPHLIHGVTGSGKTRLYLELAAEALAENRSVIVLVPEITLTPQVVAQFESAFGDRVLTTHSKLTEAQRHRIWTEATSAATAEIAQVVVGPRSSLFLPLHHLGLIIIDECHENTYKQEQHPRYHAVPTAARLAQLTGARLILGSATPGLSELFLAQAGRLNYHRLQLRANKIAHSQAIIIDQRNKELFRSNKFIAQPLQDAVSATLESGRQSLLYLNRRGSASSQVCGQCGHVTICPNCQLPLTFHADLLRLICHHCNFRRTSDAVCPECGAAELRLLGGGTKRIEAEAERLWPGARIARLDRDSANLRHIETVYRGLKAGEIDIIIGTQMIAKGLDLPGIDTIGIVAADTMLHLPDFGAAERTYQLLSQVSGRAGRGDRAGRIFIQSYTPDHPAIVAAARGEFDRFAASELEARQALRYPPYVYLLKLTLAAATRDTATAEASAYAGELRRDPSLAVIGPAPAFIETVGGSYHWILTVKSARRPPLVQLATQLPSSRWTADLDPVNLL